MTLFIYTAGTVVAFKCAPGDNRFSPRVTNSINPTGILGGVSWHIIIPYSVSVTPLRKKNRPFLPPLSEFPSFFSSPRHLSSSIDHIVQRNAILSPRSPQLAK